MKVVGLLSGGKDSVYNLLHCIINNHEPVAVASVGPPENKGLLPVISLLLVHLLTSVAYLALR